MTKPLKANSKRLVSTRKPPKPTTKSHCKKLRLNLTNAEQTYGKDSPPSRIIQQIIDEFILRTSTQAKTEMQAKQQAQVTSHGEEPNGQVFSLTLRPKKKPPS
jgi:hypothetical protein